VFNQEFIVDERYNVTKELGQGAYGIVWYDSSSGATHSNTD
jgi:mitogen-activated protein kinase 7